MCIHIPNFNSYSLLKHFFLFCILNYFIVYSWAMMTLHEFFPSCSDSALLITELFPAAQYRSKLSIDCTRFENLSEDYYRAMITVKFPAVLVNSHESVNSGCTPWQWEKNRTCIKMIHRHMKSLHDTARKNQITFLNPSTGSKQPSVEVEAYKIYSRLNIFYQLRSNQFFFR